MASSYIIPPYLLQTCLGLELHQQIFQLDPDLANANKLTDSAYFRDSTHIKHASGQFSLVAKIDALIKEKVKDKLAVIGVLGESPSTPHSAEYLRELYDAFKSRLVAEPTGDEFAGEKKSARITKSIFENPKVGEYLPGPGLGNAEDRLLHMSLEQLIAEVKSTAEHRFWFLPYLEIGPGARWLSSLPMYWTPLLTSRYLVHLDQHLQMSLAFDNGVAVLKLAMQPLAPEAALVLPMKTRFYNFIANSDVEERTGVFYYEVKVEQTAATSAAHKTLIHTADSSLSSGSSLSMKIGFTKRNVKFDKLSTSAAGADNTLSIDYKSVLRDLFLSASEFGARALDDDTQAFLSAEPGVSLDGSFAVGFGSSCSYLAVKSADSYRSSSLNRRFSQLNRLSGSQETSNLDFEVPLPMYTETSDGVTALKTDTVGVGLNLLEKSIFITLNGILVKTIADKDLLSMNRHKDSLFSDSASYFPVLGFQLSDLSDVDPGETLESRIFTNFGQANFLYNIDQFVLTVKARHNAKLGNLQELKPLPSQTEFENYIGGIEGDPSRLNALIAGYLVKEGHVGTLEAFGADLADLAVNTNRASDFPHQDEVTQSSNAIARQKLRQLLSAREFENALEYLKNVSVAIYDRFYQDILLLRYHELLINLVEARFGFHFQGDTERTIFEKACKFGTELLSKCTDPTRQKSLEALSGVLLVKTKAQYEELELARVQLKNHDRAVDKVVEAINEALLEELGYYAKSRLEIMIHGTGENVQTLSNANEGLCAMINFERDYVDV